MPRTLHKLNDGAVRAATKAGRLSDGGGLYLRVKSSGTKSWSFVWKRGGRKTANGNVIPNEIGLGPYPTISLAEAREIAAGYRYLVARGGNPKEEKTRASEPMFSECVEQFLEAMEDQWGNAKHRQQWRNTLRDYCKPLASKRVSDINLKDVLGVLKPIWNTKPETASRLRGRIERVLSFAQTKGWRTDTNPAIWRGNLQNVLPKPRKLTKGHHRALPYQDLPAFMELLGSQEALAARALEFLIFTAARSGEILRAQWAEVDFDNAVWTVPAERMKGVSGSRREHRVPLTFAAINVLKPLHETRINEWIFPGQAPERPLSGMAMEMLLRRMKVSEATPHGFRSSFRDWAGDETTFPREIAEMCLAHKVGDDTENAYRRSDALKKRRALLEAWASHCRKQSPKNIIALHG